MEKAWLSVKIWLKQKTTIHDFMIRKIHGDAGIRIIVEEFLRGFEASVIAFSNGEKILPLHRGERL